MPKAQIISFINYKGGVGKTTTTYHVGCSLAYHHNKKVLLVDIDPQTNLTFLCVDFDAWKKFKLNKGTIATMYQMFLDKKAFQTTHYIWKCPVGRSSTKIHELDLIPGDLELLGEDLSGMSSISQLFTLTSRPFEMLKKHASNILREWGFLREAIYQIRDKYDYILIDCPPNLYLMTQNALFASDWYVVTVIPEYLSVIGLSILVRKVDDIKDKINKTANMINKNVGDFAKFGGIIFVKVRIGGSIVTTQHTNQMGRIKEKEEFQGKCFETYTTELIGYSEAAEQRLPIWLADTPNAKKAAKKMEYEKITLEFMRRFPS